MFFFAFAIFALIGRGDSRAIIRLYYVELELDVVIDLLKECVVKLHAQERRPG